MKILASVSAATLAMVLLGQASSPEVPESGQRPNILVVRVDELRASSVGAYGDPYGATPNIDKLAGEGVLYERALSSEPVCSAHRTSFDTGLFTWSTRNGDKLHPNDETIQDVLDSEGYHTFHIGKWHKTPPGMVPKLFAQLVPSGILDGFDYHAGHEHNHSLKGPAAIYYVNGAPVAHPAGPWRPQVHVDLALAQVDAALASGTPFYGVVDLEPPHFPYGAVIGTQWDIYQQGDIAVPANVPAANVVEAEGDLARYYSMLFSVDDMLGQLVDHLDAVGAASSTVVIFTSDHGGHLGAHGLIEDDAQKRSPYVESIGVPLIVRSRESAAGSRSSRFFSAVDFKPMILRLAHVPIDPRSHGLLHLPAGRLIAQVDDHHTPDGAWYGFVRQDGMKYARSEGSGPWLLFDTAVDPLEQDNLIGTGDIREAEMQVLLDEAAAVVGLVIPF